MSVIAYSFINTNLGKEDEVLKKLRMLSPVQLIESQKLYGLYDVVIKLKGETFEQVKEYIGKVRKLDNVQSTITMIVA